MSKIDLAALNKFLAAKTAQGPCEACGRRQWVFFEGGDGDPSLPIQSSSGNVIIPAPHIPTIALICDNCGNVRLHAKLMIEAYLTQFSQKG